MLMMSLMHQHASRGEKKVLFGLLVLLNEIHNYILAIQK